jgi:hypothetical protein
MSGKKAFVPLVIISVLGTTSAAWSSSDADRRLSTHHRLFVMPCSLVGINPVWHPNIFGNPAVAREYGFIRSKDGTWRVEPSCLRGPYHH